MIFGSNDTLGVKLANGNYFGRHLVCENVLYILRKSFCQNKDLLICWRVVLDYWCPREVTFGTNEGGFSGLVNVYYE